MSRKSKKPFKERFEDKSSNEPFIDTLKGQQVNQLKETLVILSKQVEEIQHSREESTEIRGAQEIVDQAKEALNEVLSPYKEAETVLKDKIRYITVLLKEKQ